MIIDQNAPLYAKNDIVIYSSIEKIWSLLTEINKWPMWQPDVTSAKLMGNLSVGAVFTWKAKGLNIHSTIRELVPFKCIGWSGDSIGMNAIHCWSFEQQGNSMNVTTEESLNGWFSRLLKTFDPYFLNKSLAESLKVLKTAAEKE